MLRNAPPTLSALTRRTPSPLAAVDAGALRARGGGAGDDEALFTVSAMVGGLLVSQVLTLYTTPAVYLYFDRIHVWLRKRKAARAAQATPTAAAS